MRQLKQFWTNAKYKRGNSTRQLSQQLASKGHDGGKNTIWRFMKSKCWRPLRRQKKPLLTAKQCAAWLKFAKQYKSLTAEEWDDFRFSHVCPKYLSQLPNPKNDIVWGSQESQVPPAYQVKKSSKRIIWGGMTGRGLTGIHFLPQGQTLTDNYYINNILEKEVKPVLHRKNVNEACNRQAKIVQFQSPHDVRPRWAASTCSQGHPGMVQIKPAKFYRENMLAPKFPRYQPCGESLEHNGWSCL